MAELIVPNKAKVTVTVELPSGEKLSASQTVETTGWAAQPMRDFDIARTTKAVMVGLLSKWDTLRSKVN